METTDYLNYLSKNIMLISVDKQENLQPIVEDFINDIVDIHALSEAAISVGLFDFNRFRKHVICSDILGN